MSEEHRNARTNENRIVSIKPWTAEIPAPNNEPPNMRGTIFRKKVLQDGYKVDKAEYKVAQSWPYKYVLEDHQGTSSTRILFHRARYNFADPETGETDKLYLTWYSVQYDEGGSGWAYAGMDEKLVGALPDGKWPLYSLELLAHFDAAQVWVVEGEKAADYINQTLKPKGVVAVSASVYGAITDETSAGTYNWAPLVGRDVIVWPDNDDPGRRMGRLLTSLNPSWCMVSYPPGTVVGWDLADHATNPLADNPIAVAKEALPNIRREAFLRESPNSSDMPREEDLTFDNRRIVYWNKIRDELSIDTAIPLVAQRYHLFDFNGQVVSVGNKTLLGAHRLGTADQDAPPSKLIFEPPAPVVAEEINRVIEFGTREEVLDRDGAFQYYKWKPKQTTQAVGTRIKGRRGKDLNTLLGVIDYPAFAPGGRLLQGSGYDPTSHLYLATPNLSIDIGETQVEAEKAYNWLVDELFADVLFEADVDKAMAIAAPLTLMVKRSYFVITPGILVNAFLQETGKTTLCNMWSNMVVGTDAAAYPFGNELEERRKQLFSIARQGPPMVVFDNIADNGTIDDPMHSQFITTRHVSDRVLGASEMSDAYSNFVMVYTGNNLTKGTDLASRIMDVRLFSPDDAPMHRTFQHPDPIGFVHTNRAKILSALSTIFMANHVAGSDMVERKDASRFPQWDKLVRSAVLFASGVDPVRTKEERQMSDTDLSLRAFLQLLQKRQHVLGDGTGLTIGKMWADRRKDGQDGLFEAIRELYTAVKGVWQEPTTIAIGKFLSGFGKKPIGQLRLEIGVSNNAKIYFVPETLDQSVM